MNEIKDILERLKTLFNLKKDVELADKLSVHYSNITAWRNRNTMNYEILFTICKENKINLNWLINGEGEIYLHQENIYTNNEPNLIISEPTFAYNEKNSEIVIKLEINPIIIKLKKGDL
jgi:hypothetical protein